MTTKYFCDKCGKEISLNEAYQNKIIRGNNFQFCNKHRKEYEDLIRRFLKEKAK